MIDAYEDVTPAAARRDLTPVAVTRWTARLVDPQTERDFLEHCFPANRSRMLLLLAMAAVASILNLLIELDARRRGAEHLAPLLSTIIAIALPIVGIGIIRHLRTPQMLDRLMLTAMAVGAVMRFSMLSYHPDLTGLWTTMMVGIVFVIYLYLPLRLSGASALAATFSILSPMWWMLHGAPVQPEVFYRGLIWLLLANTLGFTAANFLQRSQRMEFAQSLLLRRLLSTDAMTGIANRRRFDVAIERAWQRCRRAGAPMSLLMIDVDHFKAYNDHCGHPQGDACLRQVAQLLVDTVGRPGDVVARYGGEEFVCLLPDIGSAGALGVANKIATALRLANIFHPRSPAGPRLTISIGVATSKALDGRPEDLVEFADKLLYAAKASGRNQISVGQVPAAKPAVTVMAAAAQAAA